VKTPLEFVASAVRATGADVDDAMPLARQLNNMGMPLYGAQLPTGYSMKKPRHGLSSSALLSHETSRWALTAAKSKGVKVDAGQLSGRNSARCNHTAETLETVYWRRCIEADARLDHGADRIAKERRINSPETSSDQSRSSAGQQISSARRKQARLRVCC